MSKPKLPNFFTIPASPPQRKAAYGIGGLILLITIAISFDFRDSLA